MQIEYTLYGRPVPMGRPRVFRYGHVITPDRTRDAQKEHKWACGLAKPEGWPMTGEYELFVSAHMPDRRWIPDVDNLGKLVQDALQGVAYDNDRDVCRILAERYVGTDEPRTVVIVRCLA